MLDPKDLLLLIPLTRRQKKVMLLIFLAILALCALLACGASYGLLLLLSHLW